MFCRKMLVMFCLLHVAVILYTIFVSRPVFLDRYRPTFFSPNPGMKSGRNTTLAPNLEKLMLTFLSRKRAEEDIYALIKPLVCPSKGQNMELVIVVPSAPVRNSARMAIRGSWRRSAAKIVFLIGQANNSTLMNIVEAERRTHKDILLGNFADTFNNLTLKTIAMLGWVKDYCPRVKFVLKCDDDVFINVPRLLKYISTLQLGKRAIYGRIIKHSSPSRVKGGKRYVSYKNYKPIVYPSYAMGYAYLIPGELVEEFYYASLHHHLLKLEDVFLTGIVATNLQVPRIHNDEFQNAVMVKPCFIEGAICVHGVTEKQQIDFWKQVLRKDKC